MLNKYILVSNFFSRIIPESLWNHSRMILKLFRFFFRSENIKYDVKYALRLCCERADMHREAVYLFCVLGHLEEAVTVALEQLTLGPSMSDYQNFISIFS